MSTLTSQPANCSITTPNLVRNQKQKKIASTNLLFGELGFFGDILELFVQMI